jgi:hypothetical protein
VRKKEKEAAPKEAGQPVAEDSEPQTEARPVIQESAPIEMDVFPQPGMNTHLLPEDAPSIVTGYVRLITLGVSFFLAVYLGLEAFSIFVSFPAKLPISSLLITYGHLSNSQAAYALLGLLFAEVAVVQLWAWRTRKSSLEYEEVEEEPAPTVARVQEPVSVPTLAVPASPSVDTARASPAIPLPGSPSAPIAPEPLASHPPESIQTVAVVAPLETPGDVNADAPDINPASLPETENPATEVETRSKPEQKPVVVAQVTQQEQQSGMASQFESQPTAIVSGAGSTPTVAPREQPVSAPKGADLRRSEPSPPTAAGAPFITRYQIYPDNPEVYVGIQSDPETGGYRYVVVEPRLTALGAAGLPPS